jgi:hypothetical protein
MLGGGCQTPPDTGDTWLLAASTASDFAPGTLIFRNVETGERYSIRFRSQQVGMIPVPAGRYALHRVDSMWENVIPWRVEGAGGHEFGVKAGHVNEWGILHLEKVLHPSGQWTFRVRVVHTRAVRDWALENEPDLLARVPIVRVPTPIHLPAND